MIKFTDAAMLGAEDKKFENQYNFLVELLSTYLTRGLISSVNGKTYLDLQEAEIKITATIDDVECSIVMNPDVGLAFYQGTTYRGGLEIVDNKLSLTTDVIKSGNDVLNYITFTPIVDFFSNDWAMMRFWIDNADSPAVPIEHLYIAGNASVTPDICHTILSATAMIDDALEAYQVLLDVGAIVPLDVGDDLYAYTRYDGNTTSPAITNSVKDGTDYTDVYQTQIAFGVDIKDVDTFKVISTGATILGNAIWHAGNDGSGSTLDADTLDTYHASSFLRIVGSGTEDVAEEVISAGTASAITITTTGSTVGDFPLFSFDEIMPSSLILKALVGTDYVAISLYNPTSGNITVPASTWKAVALR